MRSTCRFVAVVAVSAGRIVAAVPTPGHIPPEAVGNEADAKQLVLAKRQDSAHLRAVAWKREGASWSAEARAGDYHLFVAITPAEGGWFWDGGRLNGANRRRISRTSGYSRPTAEMDASFRGRGCARVSWARTEPCWAGATCRSGTIP